MKMEQNHLNRPLKLAVIMAASKQYNFNKMFCTHGHTHCQPGNLVKCLLCVNKVVLGCVNLLLMISTFKN